MVQQHFHDVRALGQPSGVLDMRALPLPVRQGIPRLLHRLARDLSLAPAVVSAAGVVVIPEPPMGPNAQWFQAIFEVHRHIEVAVAHRIQMLLRVERVYLLHFQRFSDSDWNRLARLFQQLPEWQSMKPHPHWFGPPENGGLYLQAKVEPGGLRVQGTISKARWVGWDTWMRSNIVAFPLQPTL